MTHIEIATRLLNAAEVDEGQWAYCVSDAYSLWCSHYPAAEHYAA